MPIALLPLVALGLAAAPAKQAAAHDRLPRPEFNTLAAAQDLPLFWRADADKDGELDPEELAVLWSPQRASKRSDWVTGRGFTPRFEKAYALLASRPRPQVANPQEQRRRELVLQELSQGRPTLIETDLTGAGAADRALVARMQKVAALIERLYARQNGVLGLDQQIPADDAASRALFHRNQGPWCEAPATEREPLCNALPGLPRKRSGLYPAALQDDAGFCEKLEARPDQKELLAPFSVVREAGKGALKAVPYHVEYRADMKAVADELKAAAAGLDPQEAALKAYLLAAAQAFLDDDWQPADEAWAKMGATNSRWYLRAAPDEVYWEPCSQKAGFHLSFARINQDSLEWQRKLDPLKNEMEKALADFAGPPYQPRPVAFHLPDFIDVVINAGDSRSALGATMGQSLPNWGPVANEGRGRTVAMTNIYTDPDSEAVFLSQVSSLVCQASMDRVVFDPKLVTLSTVLHEAAHNLGPAHEYQVAGKTDSEIFGGPLASTLEELKAQTAALYFTDWMVEKGLIDAPTAAKTHVRDLAWAFGHIAQGMYTAENKPKAYSQLAAIQVGWLSEKGALSWRADEMAANGQDKGCLLVKSEEIPRAVRELAATVLAIKGSGDRAGAEKLKARYVDEQGAWSQVRGTIQERWLRAPRASFVYEIR